MASSALFFALLLASRAAVASPPSPKCSTRMHNMIRRIDTAMGTFATKGVEPIAALFTDDAVWCFNGACKTGGASYASQFRPLASITSTFATTTSEFRCAGDRSAEWKWNHFVVSQGGCAGVIIGSAASVFDDDMKITHSIFNGYEGWAEFIACAQKEIKATEGKGEL